MRTQAAQSALMASINSKDVELQQKFPDYKPQDITQFAIDLQKIQPADAREYLYKAKMYEMNVKKAYEMGKLEGQGKLNSKLNIIAPVGTSIVANEDKPVRSKGESDQAYFIKLAQFRLAQSKAQK